MIKTFIEQSEKELLKGLCYDCDYDKEHLTKNCGIEIKSLNPKWVIKFLSTKQKELVMKIVEMVESEKKEVEEKLKGIKAIKE